MFCGPWWWNGPGTSVIWECHMNVFHLLAAALSRWVTGSQIPRALCILSSGSTMQKFLPLLITCLLLGSDKSVPTPYMEGFRFRENCHSDAGSWNILGVNQEERKEISACYIERRVSPTMECFLGFFMEQPFLFRWKKIGNYHTTYCLFGW